MEHEVTLQTINLEFTQREMIMRLAIMAEYHDHETGNHVLRMASLSKALATACGFDKNFIETIYLTSPMHDVGKIGVPAAILQKPGKLTQKEWTVVKQHCKFGKEILSNNFPHLDSFWKELPDLSLLNQVTEVPNRFLETASKIAYTHHEHWDGKGYPLGLEREQIPIEGRITALTDAYDVMRSKRPYKEAYPEEEVIRIIKAEAGYHFDPYLVKVLIGIRKQVNSIFNQYLENVE
ncbi:MAG: hypothetical protein CVU39_09855 [Chloroflexi bacterium HGW-Chloroflexi-10]|nr:MAG: hypothetical protein CVU39_09855 [Chloroflexi bacterium HGW-Chloroflexi-10]